MPGATTKRQTEATAAKSDRSEQARTPVAQPASANTADTDPGAETREDADLSALGGQAPDAFLDSLALSFLTESPDLERLDQGMRFVAQHASVDESSIVRDEASGKVEGKLVIANADIDAKFMILNGHYEIELIPYPQKVLPYPFEKRHFKIDISERNGSRRGSIHSGIYFYPDYRETSSAGFRLERETIMGWGVFITPDGTEAQPLSMQPYGDGKMSMGPGTTPRIHDKEATDMTAYDPFLKLLLPYAQ